MKGLRFLMPVGFAAVQLFPATYERRRHMSTARNNPDPPFTNLFDRRNIIGGSKTGARELRAQADAAG